jgi:hypothetical protein
MNERGSDNNRADASVRSGGGVGGGNANDAVQELVDFHAFLLGLVGDGAGPEGDAKQNREEGVVAAGGAANMTPAGRGRSVRAMAGRNPETRQLMDIVAGTLKRSLKLVMHFRQLVCSTTKNEGKQDTFFGREEDPLIQAVISSGAVRELVEVMGRQNDEGSDEATRSMIHFVDAGTKLHIQNAIDEGVLPKLVGLLVSPGVELRKEAAEPPFAGESRCGTAELSMR